mgnify:CR=1 FL=1
MRLLFAVFFGYCSFLMVGQNKGNLNLEIPSAIEQLQQDYQKQQTTQNHLEGYRVQIYNGRKNECMRERSNFLKLYPRVATYTVYESPEYRIQVGDFRTRLEAEKFRKNILEHFSGSFVLKTTIKWPDLDLDIEVHEVE